MEKQRLQDIDIKGKRVLIRVDYNVPMDDAGNITDDNRIAHSLETLRHCIKNDARVVLMSHMGRPDGSVDPKYSLAPVAKHLSQLIKRDVKMLPDCVGAEVEAHVAQMEAGEIALLENLRFHKEETANDPEFSKKLASLADIFVCDAFGSVHRAHASTVGVTKYLPAVCGFLLAREIGYLGKAIENPERPFITILGGAKVSDKVKLIKKLIEKADMILIGGAMAYTFYKLVGIGIGNSKYEPEGEPAAREALEIAKAKNFPLVFPVDRVVATSPGTAANSKIVNGDIPAGWSGFDIGPQTIEKYRNLLKAAKTVLWNGPVGFFEVEEFSKGTRGIADMLAGMEDTTTIIGGGDTAAAIRRFGLEDKMSHISTGGGASLSFLEGTPLPGVEALLDKEGVKGRS
ncbi:MAG: phosphoglycerate kinase [Candidatus Omnitrophota bacterium]|nr:phosphoglycerate kinase [Candidatus Omnitrophota bacterium]